MAINIHIHQHGDGLVKEVLSRLNRLYIQGQDIMHTIQDVATNLAATKLLVTQLIDVVSKSDAEKNALKAKIADLIAAAAIEQSAKDALATQIDDLFTQSDDLENTARAGVPHVPPVGGTPLATSFADGGSFTDAVAAYSGPESVTLNGSFVKTGTEPAIAFFTHSADGHVDTNGPTD